MVCALLPAQNMTQPVSLTAHTLRSLTTYGVKSAQIGPEPLN